MKLSQLLETDKSEDSLLGKNPVTKELALPAFRRLVMDLTSVIHTKFKPITTTKGTPTQFGYHADLDGDEEIEVEIDHPLHKTHELWAWIYTIAPDRDTPWMNDVLKVLKRYRPDVVWAIGGVSVKNANLGTFNAKIPLYIGNPHEVE